MSSSFFKELKRRNVFKVGLSYLLLGWVVLQIADVLVPALALPDWTISFLFVLGLLGFPFAIFFSWAFELTSEGLKRETDIQPSDSITGHTGRKLDFVIIGLLVLALGYFIWESRLATTDGTTKIDGLGNQPITDNNVPLTKPVSLKVLNNSSIAVLPFVNMSSDPEQEYFSDGISEELLNLLAKIPNLQVAARTSSFQFKGKNLDIKTIAEQLGVNTILEGSIRKSGNKVRITAQLIKADDGFHLWSETYDRELDDIFKVQDEISAAIVHSLKSKLGIEVTILKSETFNISSKAHDYYLRGLKGLNTSTFPSLKNAQKLFQQVVDIEPNFVPAKLGLARSIYDLFFTGSVNDRGSLDRAENILNQILGSNPQSADALYLLSLTEWLNEKPEQAIQHFKDAYKMDPDNLNVLPTYSHFSYYQRLTDFFTVESLTQIYDKAIIRDPLNFDLYYSWGIINTFLFMNHEVAKISLNRAKDLAPDNGNPPFVVAYMASLHLGDLVTAITNLKLSYKTDTADPDWPIALADAYLSLRDLDNAAHYSNIAIEASPTSAHAMTTKVWTFMYQNKNDDALGLVLETLKSKKYFHRRFSKYLLVNAGVYLYLKNNKVDEAEALLLEQYPHLKDDIDAPPPDNHQQIDLMINTYRIIMNAKKEAAAGKLLKSTLIRTEQSLLKNRPRLAGRDYLFLALDKAGIDSDKQTLNYLNKMYDSGYVQSWRALLLWHPVFMHLHEHPEFIDLVQRIEQDMKRQRAYLDKS